MAQPANSFVSAFLARLPARSAQGSNTPARFRCKILRAMRTLCIVMLSLTASIAVPTFAQTSPDSTPIPPQVDGRRIQNVQPDALWARVDKCFLPDYPQSALAAQVAGSVAIGLCVSPQGAVTNYTLLSGHPLLAPPALAAIEQWKFQPAAGAACSRVRALFSFRRDGTTSVALAHAILPDHYGDPGLPNWQRGAADTTIVQRPANAPECEAAVLP